MYKTTSNFIKFRYDSIIDLLSFYNLFTTDSNYKKFLKIYYIKRFKLYNLKYKNYMKKKNFFIEFYLKFYFKFIIKINCRLNIFIMSGLLFYIRIKFLLYIKYINNLLYLASNNVIIIREVINLIDIFNNKLLKQKSLFDFENNIILYNIQKINYNLFLNFYFNFNLFFLNNFFYNFFLLKIIYYFKYIKYLNLLYTLKLFNFNFFFIFFLFFKNDYIKTNN
jgi:hypothetical protein